MGSRRQERRAAGSKDGPGESRHAAGVKVRAGRARRLEELVALQARLRSPGGCPWDLEQTHQSLRTFLIEECYEVLDALEARDDKKLAEELGDLLLQIVFHARIAEEEGRFDIGDVIAGMHTKMVRRHPHVFGAAKANSAREVLQNWEELKKEEREGRTATWRENPGATQKWQGKAAATQKQNARQDGSVMDGVPRTLPAVLEAYQLTRRAANIGFDWQAIEELLEKLKEETGELRRALGTQKKGARGARGRSKVEEEVGDLLFVAVNVARFLGVDPEIALKKTNRKFVERFQAMEREWRRRGGGRLARAPREEMERLWERSKDKA